MNLVEFAFGLDPKLDSTGQRPPWQLNGGALVCHFTQPPGTSQILYGAEQSSSLSNPNWASVPDTGAAGAHYFSVPVGTDQGKFVRL